MLDLNPGWLAPISSWASVIGLVLSAWALWLTILVRRDLARIERTYLFRLHASRLANRIAEHRGVISECLGDFAGFQNRAEEELRRVVVTVRSLRDMTDNREGAEVSKLFEAASNYQNRQATEELLRSIYLLLIQVEEQVQEIQEVRYGSAGSRPQRREEQEGGRNRTPVA